MPKEHASEVSFDDLSKAARRALFGFLDSDEPAPRDFKRAAVAASTLGACTRHEQTKGAARALNYAIARDISENKDALKKHIRAAMPEMRL